MFARIACLKEDGRDRSLSQKKPGWNYLLMPKNSEESQFVSEIVPENDEIVFTKTTDSAVTGTNLRLILGNMGIKNVIVAGIFTDQCVSSTVRSLADESFNVITVEDCCAAGSHELHEKELEIIDASIEAPSAGTVLFHTDDVQFTNTGSSDNTGSFIAVRQENTVFVHSGGRTI